MSLELDLRVERPGFALHLVLAVEPGEVVALLGPNGAGKTTVLRAVAGLQPLTDGSVLLDGRPLHHLPPEQRQVGLVPQDGLLLPHLSARDNVAYGLRARGARKPAAHQRAQEELVRVGLADRAAARPRQLSGGQAQRVALARALATDPRVLLLDEPLASLDAQVRSAVRTDLRRRLDDVRAPVLLVTHDPVDAHVLADRLVVLEDGRVVQQGTPAQVSARPRTPWTAGLVGLVLLPGTADGTQVDLGGGRRLAWPAPPGAVLAAVAPERVRLRRDESSDDRDDHHGADWPVVVQAVEQQGATVRVLLDGLSAVVPAAELRDLRPVPGERLRAQVAPADVEVYPA